MNYFVIGPDGAQYGPADVQTLRSWAEQNRLGPQTQLRDAATGQIVIANSVPGIFAAPPAPGPAAPGLYSAPPAPVNYPRQTMAAPSNAGDGAFWGSIIRSVAALVFFFLLHGLGVIFAGYALYYAVQCKQHGNSKGGIAIGVAVFSLVVIIIGWVLRLGGAGT